MFGPVTGNIYKFGYTSGNVNLCYVQIFNSNGAFTGESVVSSYSSLTYYNISSDETIAVSVKIASNSSTYRLVMSSDYGVTWTSVSNLTQNISNIFSCGKYILAAVESSGTYIFYRLNRAETRATQITTFTGGSGYTVLATNSSYAIIRNASVNNSYLYNLDDLSYNYVNIASSYYADIYQGASAFLVNNRIYWFVQQSLMCSVAISGGSASAYTFTPANYSSAVVAHDSNSHKVRSIEINGYIFFRLPMTFDGTGQELIVSNMTNGFVAPVTGLGASLSINLYNGYMYFAGSANVYRVPYGNLLMKVPKITDNSKDAYIRY